MVQGSLTPDKRRYWSRVLKVTFVALVAASAGLVAVQGGATLPEIAVVTLAGGAVGAGLTRYLSWIDVRAQDDWRGRR